LRNAVVNSALPQAPDESLKQMFLSLVDRFTASHLRVLAVLDDPPGWFTRRGQNYRAGLGNLPRMLFAACPELSGREEFLKLVCLDLHGSGLSSTDNHVLNVVMSGEGMIASRTTAIGKQFLAFVTAPKPRA